MADHLKTPLAVSLNQFAEMKTTDGLQLTGRALPCTIVSVNGAIVTVNFEIKSSFTLPQVTMPVAESVYVRLPIQVGDKGVALPADAFLGGMSGLGGGVADLTQRANLSTLVWFPIGNTNWETVDPNAVVITGVGSSGVLLRSGGKHVTLSLTENGILISLDGQTMTVSGGNVIVTGGDVIADGISLKTHKHTGVMTGGSNTGIPVP